jgi:hypothetical protein
MAKEKAPAIEIDGSVVDVTENISDAELIFSSSLNQTAQEERRLAKRPDISHLRDATIKDPETGIVRPLFGTGDRIVADRCTTHLRGAPWLDTRVYIVMSIDDVKGIIHCIDEEAQHHAFIGLRDQFTKLKLAPKHGNPFNAAEVKKLEKKQLQMKKNNSSVATISLDENVPRRKGRPKGTKNRPRAVILAEKQAKKLEKEAKRLAKTKKTVSKKHKPAIAKLVKK